MSLSYSYTETFTVTHARHMAAKIATDLKRVQRFYGAPEDDHIANFEIEVIELIRRGYLENITYGFQRNNNWIEPTLRYTAIDLAGASSNDDDPGRVKPGADIDDACFHSCLLYSGVWSQLTPAERDAFKKTLPFDRTVVAESGVNGYFSDDRTYSSGGRALNRASVRNFP